MKIVKLGTTEPHVVNKGTFKGVRLQLHTIAAAANVALVENAIDYSQINVKAVLIRNKQTIELFNDTLDILVRYFHNKRGFFNARKGITLVPHGVGVYAENLRLIELDFQGVINVSEGTDEIKVEVTTSLNGTYTAAANAANSLVQFEVETGVGYETHISQLTTMAIRENQKTEPFSIGDNVAKLMFINLDKTDYQTPVIKDVNFNSDRLSFQKNFLELVQYHLEGFDTNVYENQARGNFEDPQSLILFDGVTPQGFAFIHDVNMKVNFNEANVTQSKNYVAYTTFMQEERQLRNARSLYEKHRQKNNEIALTARK